MRIDNHYDCVVIGAGPAGSTAATVLAQEGCSTLLIEREKMPRHHVGESLMPETYWPLQRIGMIDKMKRAGFVEKRSVQFVSSKGKESTPFYFDERDARDCSRTWQVERGKFDHLLFLNAREKGATCADGTRVVQVTFDGERATGVKLKKNGSAPQQVTARVIVDASGQQAVVANHLGIRRENPKLKKLAIWGHFRNARRESGKNSGATVILHTEDKQAWFWYIPLSNNVISVGLVGDRDVLLQDGDSPESIFEKHLAKCQRLHERLADAQLVNDKLYVNREFSYDTEQHAGNGWVLIGDAFGFIDPIYSSGVYFALVTGERAADAILEALRDDDLSEERLGAWCEPFKAGSVWIRKLVDVFYSNDFSFGKFMQQHPQHRDNLTDLLIGRIFHDGAGRIFDDMQP